MKNELEREMIADMVLAKEIMEEAIESYNVSRDRYYSFITS